jgi:hypothetical protein
VEKEREKSVTLKLSMFLFCSPAGSCSMLLVIRR